MSDRFNPPLSPTEEAVAEKARPAKRLPILCLDFDGVLHGYQSGWQGAAIIPDPPVPGAIEFLHGAVERFHVAIFSSRSGQPGGIDAMRGWLMMHVMAAIDDRREAEHVLGLIQWPTEKPAAIVTIDDRAITFTGRWPSLDEIAGFTPWNKRLATAPAAPEPAAGGETYERVRHVKRGTEYEVLGEAEAQIATQDRTTTSVCGEHARVLQEEDRLVVYRSVADGKLRCRFTDEFRDGRFETIAEPAAGGDGWQPISTRPNPETTFVDLPGDAEQGVGFATDENTGEVQYLVWWKYCGMGRSETTHWRPLPEAPSTPTRADAGAEGRR